MRELMHFGQGLALTVLQFECRLRHGLGRIGGLITVRHGINLASECDTGYIDWANARTSSTNLSSWAVWSAFVSAKFDRCSGGV